MSQRQRCEWNQVSVHCFTYWTGVLPTNGRGFCILYCDPKANKENLMGFNELAAGNMGVYMSFPKRFGEVSL